MLKRFIAYLLILSVMAANFSYVIIFSEFKLNQKYIASALCENRDKPWLHCNGHCYLAKKIKQAEEKEKSDERQTQKNLTQENFAERSADLKFHTSLLQIIETPYHAPASPILVRSIFQPPKAC